MRNPTDPFTISEPRDQKISEFYVIQERRASCPKIVKVVFQI